MKPITFGLLSLTICFLACSKEKPLAIFKSNDLAIGIDENGHIQALTDVSNDVDYLAKDTIAPLLSIKIDSNIVYPLSAVFENDHLIFRFDGDFEAKVKIEEKASHINFELVALNNHEDIELIVWGPVPTSIDKSIGETVGVVRGESFALGIQSLNPKTLGGFPWMENDAMPAFDIFEQEDYSDLSEENKRETLYRIEAAKPESFGSTLQAYCRNRTKERIVPNLKHDNYISPIYEDQGIIGSKIALFGCPVRKTLETIGKIEIAENLPHPTIDGQWGKEAQAASSAYLIMDFGEESIDEAIAYTKKAGLDYLYHPGPFKNWGHFDLMEDQFPNGWDGLKKCVEKAEENGIHVGLHTLSNFITTNDPYVTPIPDKRLGQVGSSTLTEAVSETQTEIPIASAEFFDQYENNNLHTIRIGNELVRYKEVSKSSPKKLIGCQRGAWDTKASAHKTGEEVAKLVDHGYKVFLSNTELSIEMAQKLAELFNYCGLRQISFDGLEGNKSTGMGNYGEIIFTESWYDALSDTIKDHVIIDASRTSHYFWHMYSRMNWGEPWYADFRESQTEYRLKNQAYFQRNLMPAMLGWFSLRPDTPIEDIEWMLARSAGFDAGYAFVASKEVLTENGQTPEILESIAQWEKARMASVFSEEQKERLKAIENEFHLENNAPNTWTLNQVASFKFKHESKVRQPGEPLFTTFEFENTVANAQMHFILTAKEASISNITMELNNSMNIVLPIKLNTGESIRYMGGAKAGIYSSDLQKIREFDIDPNIFQLGEGKQTLVFDCDFTQKKENPGAALEIRIPGKAEAVGVERDDISSSR